MAAGTVDQLVGRMNQASQATFVETLTHDDRDSSYIVAWSDRGQWHQRPFKAHDVSLDGIPRHASVYLTRNGFVGGKRETELCRQVNAMMFDIDCHNPGFRKVVPCVLEAIGHAVSDGRLPDPNLMVDTGRGVQVYYVLESSISFKASNGELNDKGLAYYKDVEEALANTVKRVISEVEGAEFDSSVLEYTRVGRVPGTFNDKANRWCTLVSSSHSYYTLRDLKKFGTKSAYSNLKKAQKVRATRRSSLLTARLSGIERLQKHRGARCVGSRENMCFVYYNTATQLYGPDKALSLAQEFNSRFTSPLPQSDIALIAKTVDKNVVLYGIHKGEQGFYPLKANTVVEKLFMTNEEMRTIQFFGSKRQRDRAAAKKEHEEKRRTRNERIVHLFKMGFTQQQVAFRTGCSKRTVALVLKENGVARKDRYTLKDKFSQVIASKQKSAIFGHTSWLCGPRTENGRPSDCEAGQKGLIRGYGAWWERWANEHSPTDDEGVQEKGVKKRIKLKGYLVCRDR